MVDDRDRVGTMTDKPIESVGSSRSLSDTIARISLKTHDIDVARSFVSTNYCPAKMTSLSRNSFDLSTLSIVIGSTVFSRAVCGSGIETNLHESFDGYETSVVSTGGMSLHSSMAGTLTSRTDGGLIVDSRGLRKMMVTEQTSMQCIAVRSEELHRHVVLLTDQPVVQRLRFADRFDSGSEIFRMIFSINQAIVAGASGTAPLLSAPAAMASLRDAVLSMFVESMPNNYSEFLNRKSGVLAPRSVRKAIEFMRAHIMAPLSLEDIANAVDVSPRTLQTGFRQFLNMTPMGYLRTLRLNGVRIQLLDGSPATRISEVAYQWGFAHHGLFSANYQKLFGEPPSATLRRRR